VRFEVPIFESNCYIRREEEEKMKIFF
jgi:hypothetical protein